jgi:hypothetical protein
MLRSCVVVHRALLTAKGCKISTLLPVTRFAPTAASYTCVGRLLNTVLVVLPLQARESLLTLYMHVVTAQLAALVVLLCFDKLRK